jgi:type IV secretory pathway VirB4 component
MQDISTLEKRLERLGIQDHPKAKNLLHRATVAENPRVKKAVKQRLHVFIQSYQEYPFNAATPDTSYLDQPVILGETLANRRTYAIKEAELTRHLLTVGASGTGKTTLHYNILDQVSTPCWIFDRKRDYRALINETQNVLVLPSNRLRFNPLQPPENVGLLRWAMVFSEIFSHAGDLLSGSKNYILTHIVQLYKEYDLFRDRSPPYPCLHDLEALIKSDKVNYVRKESNYRDTVLNRLEPMTTVTGPIFDCSQGYNLEHLMKKNVVVFEFGGLNRDIQNFIQEILFAWIYEYLFHNGSRNGELSLLLVWDEAKQAFSYKKEQSDAAGIPEIDDLTARAREFGLGIMAADQEATKLTDSLKANTDTKVLLPVKDQKQFDSIADSMQLTSMQKRYIQDLDVGQAVVQHGGNKPVPVDLRYVDVEKAVSDEELREHQEDKWSSLDYTRGQQVDIDFDNSSRGDSSLAEYL